jgi:predicted MPP superfamily phosphohydrolase
MSGGSRQRSGGSSLKNTSMWIFFLVVFAIHGAVNYYIGYRGWQLFSPDSSWRWVYLAVFVFLALTFIAGRFLERVWLSPVSEALVWIGSYWLAAMLYLFLAVFVIDFLRLVFAFLPFLPDSVAEAIRREKHLLGIGVAAGVVLLLIIGHINAAHPRVRSLDIHLSKKLNGIDSLTIVMASDIHLGTIIGRSRFDRIVDTINGLNPDLILFPGDLVDEDLGPVIRENLGDHLRALRAPLGIVACTGNHEYIGGADAAVEYLTAHGVTVLRDSALTLGNGLQIVGREDRSMQQFAGKKRTTLSELMPGLDPASPIILMDHQPFGLGEAVAAGVDLQVSGHTHHGQLWPFNMITNAIYEVSWGYRLIERTHFYISSGVGTWGPPVRIGNSPEIVEIRLFSSR